MEMIFCPNCNKLTGYKRVIGFGTFFAVLLTAGVWFLAIPFYPKRCITCGLRKSDSIPWYRTWKLGLVIAVGLIAFGAAMNELFSPEASRPTANKPTSVATTTNTHGHQREVSVADLFSRQEPEIGEWVLLDGYLLNASRDDDTGRCVVRIGDQPQPSAPTTGDWPYVTRRASCGVSVQDYAYLHSSYAAGDAVVLRGRYGGVAASSGALLGDCTLIRRGPDKARWP